MRKCGGRQDYFQIRQSIPINVISFTCSLERTELMVYLFQIEDICRTTKAAAASVIPDSEGNVCFIIFCSIFLLPLYEELKRKAIIWRLFTKSIQNPLLGNYLDSRMLFPSSLSISIYEVLIFLDRITELLCNFSSNCRHRYKSIFCGSSCCFHVSCAPTGQS